MRHHVTPMTRSVADAEQNRLVLASRTGERFLTPWIPLYRIVTMLKQVRTRFACESIWHLRSRRISRQYAIHRLLEHFAFALECDHAECVVNLDPSRFIYFAVVICNVAGQVSHQEEVHELVIANFLTLYVRLIPVLDRVDLFNYRRVDAGFFADFANCRGLGAFTEIDEPLRELPSR